MRYRFIGEPDDLVPLPGYELLTGQEVLSTCETVAKILCSSSNRTYRAYDDFFGDALVALYEVHGSGSKEPALQLIALKENLLRAVRDKRKPRIGSGGKLGSVHEFTFTRADVVGDDIQEKEQSYLVHEGYPLATVEHEKEWELIDDVLRRYCDEDQKIIRAVMALHPAGEHLSRTIVDEVNKDLRIAKRQIQSTWNEFCNHCRQRKCGGTKDPFVMDCLKLACARGNKTGRLLPWQAKKIGDKYGLSTCDVMDAFCKWRMGIEED